MKEHYRHGEIMGTFFQDLSKRVHAIQSRLCIGIDPHPHLIEHIERDTIQDKLIDWSLTLANQTARHAACFKINIAFFEGYGLEGLKALSVIIPKIKTLAPVILDAKRGDISSTAAAYARACYDHWNVRSVTINPYLGMESFSPFLNNQEAGLFLLCHTSNPSAGDLQRRTSEDGLPLYAWVAKQASRNEQLGLVVGATQTDTLTTVRTYAPDAWLLCPGVGSQGGSIEDTTHHGWGSQGNLLISVSRAIAQADSPSEKAKELKEAIRESHSSMTSKQKGLARLLIKSQCVLFGSFTLKSGLLSPIYIDLRRVTGHPETYQATIEAYVEYAKNLEIEAIAALPLAGLPIASGLALALRVPMCYPRPPKSHGTKNSIEGGVTKGSRVLLIDDLATRGASAIEALPTIRTSYTATDLLVLINRESGAQQRLQEHDITLHSIFSLRTLLSFWKQESLISKEQYDTVMQFLCDGDT